MATPTAVVRSGLMLVGAVLAGCSVLTGGDPLPADTDGPRPVRASALRDALLDSTEISDIMGTSGMTIRDTRLRLFDGSLQFTDRACMAAWTPAEQTVYAHTGSTAVVAQTLSETPGRSSHFVVQAAVDFPSRADAAAFFANTAQKWTLCGNQTFVTKRGGGDASASWTFDSVSKADSTLWMTQRQENGSGWSCQRALRVSNNIAIDALACKFYAADEAVTIVHGIDARLPSV